MGDAPRSSTETLIVALRVLARDIVSDGCANATCAEAADRLEEYLKLERAGSPDATVKPTKRRSQ